MRRRLLLDVLLVALLLVSFASGWVASLLGLTEFGMHKYSSIAFAATALAHLGFNWRTVIALAKHRLQHRSAIAELTAYKSRRVERSRSG